MKREAEVVPFKTTPTDNPDVCVVHVRCPYCHREHRHVWGPGEDDLPAWRATHCGGKRNRTYWITSNYPEEYIQ